MPVLSTTPGSAVVQTQWWRQMLVALLPAAIVLAAIALFFGAGPRRFVPLWSDEVVYWNEAAVFAEAGFDGGYIVIHEEAARWDRSRFGPHGPMFPILHGAVAWVFGWRPYSPFLLNLALVSLAVLAWVRGSRAGTSPAALLVIAGFWPLLLYLPTNMQEPMHFAFAFLFALAIERSGRATALTRGWTIVLFVVAALIRPSWMLMLLPLGWRRARRNGLRGVAALAVVTALATGAAWVAFDVTAAPSPQNTRTLTRAWDESAVAAVRTLIATTSQNVRQYVSFREESPQIVLRYFLALFLVLLCVRYASARRRSSEHAVTLEIALLILVPILLVVMLAGQVESWRDFRVLAPHLLVVLLVLVEHGRWEKWAWAATLLLLPVYYNGFLAFHRERFAHDPAPMAAMHGATSIAMPFVAGADPWANTVTVHSDLLQYPMLGIPRGIGLSYVFDWDNLQPPVRSRYLLLRQADVEQLAAKVQLTPIATTPLGVLYRNGASPQPVAAAEAAALRFP